MKKKSKNIKQIIKKRITAVSTILSLVAMSMVNAYAAPPSGVDTSSYNAMIDIIFWVVGIIIAAVIVLRTLRKYKVISDALNKSTLLKSDENGVTNLENDKHFSGQHTDIAYANSEAGINIADIQKIEDEQLRNNVISNFNKAVEDGYLDYDKNTGVFKATEKGKEHIQSQSFIEQFETPKT